MNHTYMALNSKINILKRLTILQRNIINEQHHIKVMQKK